MNGTMLHEIAMRRNKIVVERWWCDAHVMPEEAGGGRHGKNEAQ